eukprot:gene95-947_t
MVVSPPISPMTSVRPPNQPSDNVDNLAMYEYDTAMIPEDQIGSPEKQTGPLPALPPSCMRSRSRGRKREPQFEHYNPSTRSRSEPFTEDGGVDQADRKTRNCMQKVHSNWVDVHPYDHIGEDPGDAWSRFFGQSEEFALKQNEFGTSSQMKDKNGVSMLVTPPPVMDVRQLNSVVLWDVVQHPNGDCYAPPGAPPGYLHSVCAAHRLNPVTGAAVSLKHEGDPVTLAQGGFVGPEGYDELYLGIIFAPNGKMYSPPAGAHRVIEIDPVKGTSRCIGPIFPGPSSFRCIGLADNGKLYCAPHNRETRVLEIDPATAGVKLIGEPMGEGYLCLQLSKVNGCFYAPPGGTMFDNIWWQTNQGKPRVLKIDPSDNSVKLIGLDLGENKYASICEGGNGKLYCAPGDATHVLEIDPVSDLVRFIGPDLGPGVAKFVTACMSSVTGSIFAAPWKGKYIMEICCWMGNNNNRNSNSRNDVEIRYIGNCSDVVVDKRDVMNEPHEPNQDVYLYSGICEGTNKLIYAFPYSAMNICEIQPDTGITRDISLASVLEPSRSRFFEFCKPLADGAIFSARSEDDVQFWIMQYRPPTDSALNIASHIRSLADDNSDNQYFDVEVHVENRSGDKKSFQGHKALLGRHEFFNAMFNGSFMESEQNTVTLKDTSPAAFEVLWDSFYCKPIDNTIKKLSCLEILEAMELAARFGVNNLKSALAEQLTSIAFLKMSPSMLPTLFRACETFDLRKLRLVCERYCNEHAQDVMNCVEVLALRVNDTHGDGQQLYNTILNSCLRRVNSKKRITATPPF